MDYWINRGRPYWGFRDLGQIEEKMSAKYIGDFCIKNADGTWSEEPVTTFYNEFPKPEHSHYFGLFRRDKNVMICDASSVAEGYWNGLIAPSGEIIYSRFRHDFRESTCGTIFVDGGRDYFRYGCNETVKNVRLTIVLDKIVTNGTLIFPVYDKQPESFDEA